jgi:hypothetical protein
MLRRGVIAVALCSFAAGCGPSAERQAADERSREERRERAEKQENEARLLASPSAGFELARRLGEHVKRAGQNLIIHNHRLPDPVLEGLGTAPSTRSFAVFAVPATSPWVVKCSPAGITVEFGSHVSGEVSEGSGDIGSEIAVDLTNASLKQEQCVEIVGKVADAVRAIADLR